MKTQQLNDDVLTELSSFIAHLPIAVFVVNERGESIICNQIWINATGYNAEEFKPLKAKDVFGKESTAKFTQLVQEVFSGKKPEDISIRPIKPYFQCKSK